MLNALPVNQPTMSKNCRTGKQTTQLTTHYINMQLVGFYATGWTTGMATSCKNVAPTISKDSLSGNLA